MKKVFSNHLFLKLGLLISTCVISQSNLRIYASPVQDNPVNPAFFSVDSSNLKHQKMELASNQFESTAYQVINETRDTHPPVFFSFKEVADKEDAKARQSSSPSSKDLSKQRTEIISSSTYPSNPEPYYQVSVPNTTSAHLEKPQIDLQDKHENIQVPHSSASIIKNQLRSIAELNSHEVDSSAYSNSEENENENEGEKPEKEHYKIPANENLIISPPRFPKIPQNNLHDEDKKKSEEDKKPSHKDNKYLSQSEELSRSFISQNENGGGAKEEPPKTILINFNNVSIIEFIRFISRISNKNFVFDETDLQFNVTIVSEEATSIENIMTALLQELRIHDLILIEQGNNLIIHKNPKVNSVSKVVADDIPGSSSPTSEIVTQVFRLNTLEPDRAIAVIRPLVSDNAILEFIRDTNHLIVTDLHANVVEIGKLLKSLDAPNSGLVIGQYVAKTTDINQLVPLVQQIMSPISKDNPLVFVPYDNSNSIFIVSSPFLVERSISILQHLDQEKGKTRIINLQELQFESSALQDLFGSGGIKAQEEQNRRDQELKNRLNRPSYAEEVRPPGGWEYEPSSTTFLRPQKNDNESTGTNILPLFIPVEIPAFSSAQEKELLDAKNALEELEALRLQRCNQRPPAPWHVGVTEFPHQEVIYPETIKRDLPLNTDYIPVPVNRSKFYIHKLQYRAGDIVATQIQQIGTSLQNTKGNDELLEAINTIQWLQGSKSLVFTGAPEYLEKVRELVEQIDIPLRQVYIEMLVLNTTVNDSLNYAVNWANRFGGGNQAGSQGFNTGASPLQGVMDSTGVINLGNVIPNPPTANFDQIIEPDPIPLALNSGFSLGVIGQNIIHKGLGLQFNSIGALVTAMHMRDVVKVILNPKIITEDNVPAQIFVGVTTPFKTQSVSNDQGSIITNNFEYRDVGTSLQVTPHLHNSDIITLDIYQERSSLETTPASTGNSNVVIGPTTLKNSTKTTVHVPSGFFVIISGLLEDDSERTKTQVPCLGSVPFIGGAFTDKANTDSKSNLMMFIRPVIIDTDEEYQNLTRHQQDVWKFKGEMPKEWLQETEEALDFLNLRSTMNTDDEDLPNCQQFAH
jgi:type III secretion protein C